VGASIERFSHIEEESYDQTEINHLGNGAYFAVSRHPGSMRRSTPARTYSYARAANRYPDPAIADP
jgi:hypothetical protein